MGHLELKIFKLNELRGIAQTRELSLEQLSLCDAVSNELELTGVLIIRAEDRINEANERFQDLLEKYFSQPAEEKDKDVRADISYQVRWQVCCVCCGTDLQLTFYIRFYMYSFRLGARPLVWRDLASLL